MIRFKLNLNGVKELLKGSDMQEILASYGQSVTQRAGSGYSSDVQEGRNRAICRVKADTSEAVADNYANNTLLKSLGGQ